MKVLTDYTGTEFRLTQERLEHIKRRPEMKGQVPKIEETLADPDQVRESDQDDTVHLYYKQYQETPVTEKHLLVVAKRDIVLAMSTLMTTPPVRLGDV